MGNLTNLTKRTGTPLSLYRDIEKLYDEFRERRDFIHYLAEETIKPGGKYEDPKLKLYRSFTKRRVKP